MSWPPPSFSRQPSSDERDLCKLCTHCQVNRVDREIRSFDRGSEQAFGGTTHWDYN
jgi:hypothetical protein